MSGPYQGTEKIASRTLPVRGGIDWLRRGLLNSKSGDTQKYISRSAPPPKWVPPEPKFWQQPVLDCHREYPRQSSYRHVHWTRGQDPLLQASAIFKMYPKSIPKLILLGVDENLDLRGSDPPCSIEAGVIQEVVTGGRLHDRPDAS